MCEVKPHQFEKDLTFRTGDASRIVGQRVKVGQVLKITHIAGGFDQLATTEYVELGYWNGHAYVPLKTDNPDATGYLIHWDGEVYLREGQYAYAYMSDVANGEVMRLRVLGKYE
jgi:hypothetical protein